MMMRRYNRVESVKCREKYVATQVTKRRFGKVRIELRVEEREKLGERTLVLSLNNVLSVDLSQVNSTSKCSLKE